MASIFSKIVKGEIPSYKVAENDDFYAFLDIAPLKYGHTLVVPKREEDYLFDLSDEEIAAMFVFVKKVAKAIKTVIPCKRVGMAVVGLDVPHAHVHLLPLDSGYDIDFSAEKKTYSAEEMKACAEKIASSFE